MEIEVVNYIKEAFKHGLTEQEIKKNLLDAGWEAAAVEESFEHAKAIQRQPLANKDEDISPLKPAEKLGAAAGAFAKILPARQAKPEQKNIFQASENISEKHFANGHKNGNFFSRPVFLGFLAALVILCGGGYFYYTLVFGKNQPEKIWEKFTKGPKSKIYKNDFKAGYFDKGLYKGDGFGDSFKLQDIKLEFEGKSYLDVSDLENPTSSSEVSYSFSSGNTNIKTGFGYRLLNKILYVNVGDNPFLNGIFNSLSPDKKIGWLGVDLNKLESEMSRNGGGKDAEKLKQIFSPNFNAELQKLWADAELVKIEKILGRETVNGIKTVHFQNRLDKQALKILLETYANKFFKALSETENGGGAKIKDSDAKKISLVVSGLADKIEIRELETWIGEKDHKLYKIHLASNAPSVINSVEGLLGEAKSKSRDAKRAADIRQLATALELYFNDFGGYPESGKGMPVGLTPTYFSVLPQAPVPPDGGCSDYYNSYWYTPTGQKTAVKGHTLYPSYEITFCLGNRTGGLDPGIAKMTQAGTQTNIPCPGEADKCGVFVQPGPSDQPVEKTDEEKVKEILDKIIFSAEFKMDSVYADYGKKTQVRQPENPDDLWELLKQSRSVPTEFIQQPQP